MGNDERVRPDLKLPREGQTSREIKGFFWEKKSEKRKGNS